VTRTTDTPETRRALEWSDLAIILAICRAGSLSGAARSLGRTHSTVFRNINAIEEKTGVRFFDRLDGGYAMTDAGRTAMEFAERVEQEFHGLGLQVLGRDEKLSGRIRITCPDSMANEIAPGLVERFLDRHPDIRIDVSHGYDAADLSRREAEIAIRATASPPESSFGRRIAPFRFAIYAAERYLERAPETTLAEHRFCLIEGTAAWLSPLIWATRQEGEDHAVFQCRSARAVVNAAAQGLGLTVLPCYAGDAEPRLVRASDTIAALDMDLWVLSHPDLRGTARVRAMMSFLYDELGALRDLWIGARRSPGRWNLMRRDDG